MPARAVYELSRPVWIWPGTRWAHQSLQVSQAFAASLLWVALELSSSPACDRQKLRQLCRGSYRPLQASGLRAQGIMVESSFEESEDDEEHITWEEAFGVQ